MTEIYKLYRKDGDVTSIEAAESLNVNRMERIVYDVIDRFGPFGCIQDQVLAKLPTYNYGTVTARFKALVEKKLIVRTDMKKKGNSGRNQRVMMSKKHYDYQQKKQGFIND